MQIILASDDFICLFCQYVHWLTDDLGGGGGGVERYLEREGDARGCEIVCMCVWVCLCARVEMRRRGRERVRYVMHY